MEKNAIYPGSFDPVTKGHMDIIKRSSKMFDKLYVAVANNSAKHSCFTTEERMELLRETVRKLEKIRMMHGIQYAAKELPLGVLPIKYRTYRCLSEAGILTVSQFMNVQVEDVKKMPGAGEKTICDILSNQKILQIGLNNGVYKPVILTLDTLGLGVRAMKCIKRAGVNTIDEFMKLSRSVVLNQWNMGEKTWKEISAKQHALKYGEL